MSERNSTSGLKPQLARHYEGACKKVYGKNIFVVKSKYKVFHTFEAKLRREGIFPKDFAYGLSKHLRQWVKDNKWDYVPHHLFCSDWAIKVFNEEISNNKYEKTPKSKIDEGMLLEEELTVARYYIEENREDYKSFRKVVVELSPRLSSTWLDLYYSRKRARLVVGALDILTEESGRYLSSYDDLLE